MFDESDEFDLDVRLFAAPGNERPPLWAPGFAADRGLQAVPDTLGTDCITAVADCNTSDTSCGFTCGCNTNETCTHACANPDAITFGYDCEDASGGECVPDGETGVACGGDDGGGDDD